MILLEAPAEGLSESSNLARAEVVVMTAQSSCMMELATDESPSPTITFDTVYDEVIKILSSPERVFPFVDIKSAERTGTLAKLKAFPMMSEFVDTFRKAGLEGQIGYNMSSCEISLTVNVKVLEQTCEYCFFSLFKLSACE
jgi:hypothetical protein